MQVRFDYLMSKADFAEWLREELRNRDWSQSDLSRRSGVSTAQITRVLSGERGIGEATCKSLARALHLPPEEVFRKAGLLPPKPVADEIMEQAEHIINGYKFPETKARALAYLEFLRVEEEKAEYRAKSARRPASSEPG